MEKDSQANLNHADISSYFSNWSQTVSKPMGVFDGHNDTLLNLYLPERGGGRNFFDKGTPKQGHIDLPRAKEAGFMGGFFAIFSPSQNSANDFSKFKIDDGYDFPMPSPLSHTHATEHTHAMMNILFQLERESDGQFKVTRTLAEIKECIDTGVISAILHFEGAEAIDTDLHALEVYYQAGLRSLGIVWSRQNAFATGVPLKFPSSPDDGGSGLTDAGKALVRACNQLGIMIDLSHINGAGFWDVANLSDAPLVATHSNVHALCEIGRNLTDKQLDAIKASDGLVGLNFAVGFLRQDGGWGTDIPLTTLVRHIDYLVDRLGIDRVGLGSDFDGAKIPDAIADVTGLPKLVHALSEAGYDESALRKLTHENWLRVLELTWK
jgi:membrane dipeptidase